MKEINNNIKEDYCSFEVSKLLKEKGFDVPTQFYWEKSLTESYHEEDGYSGTFGWRKDEINFSSGYTRNSNPLIADNKSWLVCSAPTHALAIEWLRVNFEIWISIMYLDSVGNYGFIVTTITDNTEVKEEYYHLSPEEATEAALKYVLEELI